MVIEGRRDNMGSRLGDRAKWKNLVCRQVIGLYVVRLEWKLHRSLGWLQINLPWTANIDCGKVYKGLLSSW